MIQRRRLLVAGSLGLALPAWAHHGWSSFDQDRPLYLEGRATKVMWRNPHGELELELPENPTLPADLKQRALPKQSATVDGPGLLAKAQLPTRRDRKWTIELAPLTRLQAWGLDEIKPGTQVAALGFTFTGEKGDPVLRAEYLFVGGKVYGLRSSPA
ncbi:hypothetical protein J2X90_004401 [Variovorax paradoxus]|jgi:hypothetical protein|nr:DUF6152 family protein [Variovorax paradoxus]MDP9931088.1 hypothetical protein [Variovorax paradoxus]MDQ0026576.1 hypothetical protein [Variovorax paradoxus]